MSVRLDRRRECGDRELEKGTRLGGLFVFPPKARPHVPPKTMAEGVADGALEFRKVEGGDGTFFKLFVGHGGRRSWYFMGFDDPPGTTIAHVVPETGIDVRFLFDAIADGSARVYRDLQRIAKAGAR